MPVGVGTGTGGSAAGAWGPGPEQRAPGNRGAAERIPGRWIPGSDRFLADGFLADGFLVRAGGAVGGGTGGGGALGQGAVRAVRQMPGLRALVVRVHSAPLPDPGPFPPPDRAAPWRPARTTPRRAHGNGTQPGPPGTAPIPGAQRAQQRHNSDPEVIHSGGHPTAPASPRGNKILNVRSAEGTGLPRPDRSLLVEPVLS